MRYIRWFDTLCMKDIPQVGGKNAALGQMIGALFQKNISIPNGFAVTTDAYWYFLDYNALLKPMQLAMKQLLKSDLTSVQETGKIIRQLILKGKMPPDLADQIVHAYKELCKKYNQKMCDVAVRSSATAEDLPGASFAGQQDSFLNICGTNTLLQTCKRCFASLFNDRAIIYRIEQGFDHFQVALSIGVQKMIRSDKAVSGVAFSLDTETGFKNVVMIDASWGLGEAIVKGIVNPDEYYVFKTTLLQGFQPIIKKQCGTKKRKIIYNRSPKNPVKQVAVSKRDQRRFCLSDDEVLELARYVVVIEEYYSELNKQWTPMDVEWAKDGIDGKLYIIQARPETIHALHSENTYTMYTLEDPDVEKKIITTGLSIGAKIVVGTARVIHSIKDMHKVKEGDIIVTPMTDPDWVPVMKRAAGIITDLGGRTCHAAIVSRELATPAIVGTNDATRMIQNNERITLDCSQGTIGYVYKGEISVHIKKINYNRVPEAPISIYLNIADASNAFYLSTLPVAGVGLARLEFIITNIIKIHPMALVQPEKIMDKKIKREIAKLTKGYDSDQHYFVDKLSQGIGMIAAAFYPRPVVVRLSDFKTNEYRNLIGGKYFEQIEANPMLGFRGASRYIHALYKEAFYLECAAIVKARQRMGLDNILVMVPFVRTLSEAKRVVELLAHCGLERKKDGLQLIMMCEVPSNVILIEEFAQFFDGFSIGSNDLTQLTLGVDRDSALLAPLFDERDQAIKRMLIMAIEGSHQAKRFIGICGQAPSDFPEFAEFLIKQKIDSISLNPDSVLPFLLQYSSRQ